MSLKTIILAAGQGTRMKSKTPKVIHKVCGLEMVNHVIDVAIDCDSSKNVVVVGHGADEVEKALYKGTLTALQEKQLGTGHAVKMAINHVEDEDTIIILYGDTPLIKSETVKKFIAYHKESQNHLTVLTTLLENPFGYGRIIRDLNGNLEKIVEQKDASEKEQLVKEINSGIYCFEGKELKEGLNSLSNDNSQNEYYLTDLVEILKSQNKKVDAFVGASFEELVGVNNRLQLSQVQKIMQRRINEKHMLNGVTFIDPETTYIDKTVQIEEDTIIYPSNVLKGNTKIGSNCVLEQGNTIEDSEISHNVWIQNSTILKSFVGEGTKVGPFAYIRPDSEIGKNVKIGDFVEVKKSKIGDNSKASHLTYIGDAEVGKNVNLGCGVVFVNYDGINKHKTKIGDDCFIGCNVNLISPVIVGENSYIAAGSTITDDVPKDSLSIARSRQTNKDGYRKK